MARSPAIGIDLGTTNTCVGVFRNGRVEIIPNEQGPTGRTCRTTPSCVAFRFSERLIGDDALDQACTNFQNTVYDVKRLIGRRFQDEGIKKDMRLSPFKVIDHNGYPKIQVKYRGETRDFYPEEISSMILRKMKVIAESFLGEKVTNAVITVPAYFDDSQRQATKDAATIAGLKVMRIINEPTAAAIAYGLLNRPKDQNVLVFDFGGGTIDVSILNIKNKQIVVKSTCGDTNLGGKDIDDKLVYHLMKKFTETYGHDHDREISDDPRSLAKLRESAERAKRHLSSSNKASVDIDCLFDGIDFSYEIRIAEFNSLCEHIFQKTLICVEKALDDVSMTKTDINEVILVGGSSRIPRVQELLKAFFGKELDKSINLDESVAEGATVHAAFLNGESDPRLITFENVISKSLGFIQHDGESKVIIPRNSTIPYSKSVQVRMNENETYALIQVFEREELRDENKILGTIAFDIQSSTKNTFVKFSNWLRKREVQLEIEFSVDEDEILNVSIKDKAVGIVHIFQFKSIFRSKEELDRLIEVATRFEDEEKAGKEREEALTRLELNCQKMLAMIVLDDISDLCKNSVIAACEGVLIWISQNKFAKKEEIEIREKYLNKTYEAAKETISKLKWPNDEEASVETSVVEGD